MDKNNSELGKYVWFLVDGELPEPGNDEVKGHEALCILNPNKKEAKINITVYFKDKEPVRDIQIRIGAERMMDIHINDPKEMGGYKMPVMVPYSLKIESDVKIIVQHSRLITEHRYPIFSTIAYPAK
ncbi:MAG: hypothetical protein PWQ66_303 [Petrotoga sp.]|nr:hypothetical protein [Petrotoga sp.]